MNILLNNLIFVSILKYITKKYGTCNRVFLIFLLAYKHNKSVYC